MAFIQWRRRRLLLRKKRNSRSFYTQIFSGAHAAATSILSFVRFKWPASGTPEITSQQTKQQIRLTGCFTNGRTTEATVLDHESLIRRLPAFCARPSRVRIVYNLFADTDNWSTAVSSTEAIQDWTESNSTINADNSFDLDNNAAAAILVPGSYDIDNYIVGRVYRFTIELSSSTSYSLRLIITETGTATDHTQNITVTATKQMFSVITSAVSATVTGLVPKILNESGAGAKTGIQVHDYSFEDVTGQSNTAPSRYVSYGVLSDPWHGLGVDGIAAYNYTNTSTVDGNGVVTYSDGDVFEWNGWLSEQATTSNAKNSDLTIDGAGDEPFESYARSGQTQNVHAETSDLPANFTRGCRIELEADYLWTSISASPLVKVSITGGTDSITFSIWAKRSNNNGTMGLKVQLRTDDGTSNFYAWEGSTLTWDYNSAFGDYAFEGLSTTWKRFEFTTDITVAGETQVWLNYMGRESGAEQANTNILFTGLQWEVNSPKTSFIYTEDAVVTRNADAYALCTEVNEDEGFIGLKYKTNIASTDENANALLVGFDEQSTYYGLQIDSDALDSNDNGDVNPSVAISYYADYTVTAGLLYSKAANELYGLNKAGYKAEKEFVWSSQDTDTPGFPSTSTIQVFDGIDGSAKVKELVIKEEVIPRADILSQTYDATGTALIHIQEGVTSLPDKVSVPRNTEAVLTRHDGTLMRLPAYCARLHKSRTVYNLFGDTGNWSTAVTSTESIQDWTESNSTINIDDTFDLDNNAAASVAAPGSFDIDDYIVGRKYRFTIRLSSGTDYDLRLIITESGTATDHTQNISVTSTAKTFSVITAAIENTVTGLVPKIVNESGAGAKTDIQVHDYSFEDVTGRTDQNPSEYVSYGVGVGNTIANETYLETVAAWTAYGTNTLSLDDGGVRHTYVDNGFGAFTAFSVSSGTLSDELVGYYQYLISFEAKAESSANINIYDGDSGNFQLVNTSSYTQYDVIIRRAATGTCTLSTYNLSAGEWISIRNISIKLLNHGLGGDGIKAYPLELVSSVDGNGVVTYGAQTVPVVDEGWLIESSAPNHLLNSDFSIPDAASDTFEYWADTENGSSTINDETTSVPSSFTHACRMDVDGSGNVCFLTPTISYMTVVAGTDKAALTLWGKRSDELSPIAIKFRLRSDNGAGGSIQYYNGSTEAWQDGSATIQLTFNSTWTKYTVVINPTNTGRTRLWVNYISSHNTANNYNKSLYFTGVQLEKNITATSFIYTRDAVTTRNDEYFEIAESLPQTEGTIAVRAEMDLNSAEQSTAIYVFGLDDQTVHFGAKYDSQTLQVNDDGDLDVTLSDVVWNDATQLEVAVRYSDGDSEIGYAVDRDNTFVYSSLDTDRANYSNSSIQLLDNMKGVNYIEKIAIHDEEISDADFESLNW